MGVGFNNNWVEALHAQAPAKTVYVCFFRKKEMIPAKWYQQNNGIIMPLFCGALFLCPCVMIFNS